MSVYVFLGPTLAVEEARAILDATYLPPVACGDVQRLMFEQPEAIAIIDGLFEQKPAVFHKEILHALSQGVRVFGASSMGALRAAELHPFGMEGHGRIFEAFASGELEDDDEVTVIHGDVGAGHVPYSEAMVNIREGLDRARRVGVISGAEREQLVGLAKDQFYAERSWKQLYRSAEAAGLGVDRLRSFIDAERPNLKRDDAVSLLRHMAGQSLARQRQAPSFDFAATSWWRRLRSDVAHAAHYGARASDDVPAKAFTLHALLCNDPGRTLSRDAILAKTVADAADLMGIGASPTETKAALQRLGLGGDTLAEVHAAKLEVLIDKVAMAHRTAGMMAYVPLALLRRRELDGVVGTVRRKWEWLRARGLERPTFDSAGIQPADLFDWYRRTYDAREETPAQLCAALGLSRKSMWEELLRDYVYRSGTNS